MRIQKFLYCLDAIIESYVTGNLYDTLLKDEKFYVWEKNKWLPIWGILSQILANFYLNDLDQFLKHTLKVQFVRYMDDIVIVWEKFVLRNAQREIFKFIAKDKLILNPRKTSFNLVKDGVTFVWYRIKDNRVYAWKRIKKWLLRFVDTLTSLDNKDRELLTQEDNKKIQWM